MKSQTPAFARLANTSIREFRGRVAKVGLGHGRGLKKLDAVISAPLMRLDGTTAKVGYDPDTHLLLDVTEPLQDIPADPTPDELRAALKQLWSPFQKFPFCGPVDRAVLLCALMTAVQRPILPTAPAFAFDAPRQGTGKSLVAECVGIVATGELPQAWPHIEKNEEEIRKRLLTALRGATQVMLWDNVVGQFDSPAFATLLTSPNYGDRVLGVSDSESYPNRMLALLTGNNFSPSGELPRRVLTCRLDAASERPFTRTFGFNPRDMFLADRQSYVRCVLILLRGYVAAGSPTMSTKSLGSFGEWDKMIRQAVIWIGTNVAPENEFSDPLISVLERDVADPADEALGAMMVAWCEHFGDEMVAASELLKVHRKTREYLGSPSEAESRLADGLEEFSHGRNLTGVMIRPSFQSSS